MGLFGFKSKRQKKEEKEIRETEQLLKTVSKMYSRKNGKSLVKQR